MVGYAFEEVAVVADHHQRPRPPIEQVFQLGQRVHIQVVSGLVEEQHVRLVHQDRQQLQPAPLPAGQLTSRRPLRVTTQTQPVQQLAGRPRAHIGREVSAHRRDRLPRGQRRIQPRPVLSQITKLHRLGPDDPALDRKRRPARQQAAASGTWNGAGQLTAYTNAPAPRSPAAYDGSGLRASATFTPAGGSATTQNFVWDTTPTVPQLLMDSASAYIYTGPGAPAEQVSLTTGTPPPPPPHQTPPPPPPPPLQ